MTQVSALAGKAASLSEHLRFCRPGRFLTSKNQRPAYTLSRLLRHYDEQARQELPETHAMTHQLTLSSSPGLLDVPATAPRPATWLLALVLVVAGWLLPTHAPAAPLSKADEASVRAVVEGQLAALASDDARKAFSFSAPNVRETVGTAERFMAMVRAHYPAIYRPASTAFIKPESYGEPADRGDQAVQRVHLIDNEGNGWVAIYSLQRQPGKTWRITGCRVQADKSRMT